MLNQYLVSISGSFVCECPLGLELTEDGKRCKVNKMKYISTIYSF